MLKLDVSAADRPLLRAGETVLCVQTGVGLYVLDQKSPDHGNGTVYLTTHRICYVDERKPKVFSLYIELARIRRHEYSAGFLKSSAKITLYVDHAATAADRASGMGDGGVTHQYTWVCEICSFVNSAPPLVDCKSCGSLPPVAVVGQMKAGISDTSRSDDANSDSGKSSNGYICPRCTFINHPSLRNCEICNEVLQTDNIPPTLRNMSFLQDSFNTDADYYRLSFRAGGDRIFYKTLRESVAQRKWEPSSPISDNSIDLEGFRSPDYSTLGGIARLELVAEGRRDQNVRVLGTAFEDLEALMKNIKSTVALAEAFAKTMSKSHGDSEFSEALTILFESSQDLGLSTPAVSKEIVGKNSIYYDQLARNIVEFLEQQIDKEGGVVALPDLYALYNRSRSGSDLISPTDLRKSVELFAKLNLPFIRREFKSGVVVVQRKEKDETEIGRKILDFVKNVTQRSGSGVLIQDCANQFHWSLIVANEELQRAEQAGILVRDTGIEGVRFWENRFDQMHNTLKTYNTN